MHHELKESGLSSLYKMASVVNTTDPRAKLLGKTVRFKRELLTKDFLRQHGTSARDSLFIIKEVQNDYRGEPIVRGYDIENDPHQFGRALDPQHLEII